MRPVASASTHLPVLATIGAWQAPRVRQNLGMYGQIWQSFGPNWVARTVYGR
jgi:hypothetical protein